MRRRGKRWIQRALGVKRRRVRGRVRVQGAHKGALHRMLGVPMGQKIPLRTLEWASRQGGKLGQRARFALNARKFKHNRSGR